MCSKPTVVPPTPTPLCFCFCFFSSSSCRDGVEDVDSQGDGSSQPDTISIASRTSQNTVDSDKVGQCPNLPSPKTSCWLNHPWRVTLRGTSPTMEPSFRANCLFVPAKVERAGLEKLCHSVEMLYEGTKDQVINQTSHNIVRV